MRYQIKSIERNTQQLVGKLDGFGYDQYDKKSKSLDAHQASDIIASIVDLISSLAEEVVELSEKLEKIEEKDKDKDEARS